MVVVVPYQLFKLLFAESTSNVWSHKCWAEVEGRWKYLMLLQLYDFWVVLNWHVYCEYCKCCSTCLHIYISFNVVTWNSLLFVNLQQESLFTNKYYRPSDGVVISRNVAKFVCKNFNNPLCMILLDLFCCCFYSPQACNSRLLIALMNKFSEDM